MKKLLLITGLAFLVGHASAQPAGTLPTPAAIPQAYESQITYQKSQQQAALIDLPYSPSIAESSIKDYMARFGWRGSGKSGYTVYRNVRLTDSAAALNDVYIRADRKNKDRSASVVTALVVQPGQDPATVLARDPLAIERGKALLEKMVPTISSGHLESRIDDQTKTTKKAQGKLSDLRGDQLDLEKKIKDAQVGLDQNKTNQLQETQTMQAAVTSNDNDAIKKSHKRMDKLISQQKSLQNKLQKYQGSLEQNKKDLSQQEIVSQQQQSALDSLRSQRKN